jgi:hypothetical protein
VPDGPVTVLGHAHDLTVVGVGAPHERTIVHLAADRRHRRRIVEQRRVEHDLAADRRLDPLRPLLPRSSVSGRDAAWIARPASPGVPGAALTPEQQPAAILAGLDALDDLHGCTAEARHLSGSLLDALLHDKLVVVAAAIDDPLAAAGLAALRARLVEDLAATAATVCRIHGDPSPDNLLVDDSGATVTAMIDWESSAVSLPEVDVIAHQLAWRRLRTGRELGTDVLALIADGWTEEEEQLLGPGWRSNDHLSLETLALLTWLHHVAANLTKAERYSTSRWWVRRNVEHVLRSIADDASVDGPGPDGSTTSTHEAAPIVAVSGARPDGPSAARSPRPASGPAPVALRSVRWAVLAATTVAWATWATDQATAVRAVPVLLALLALPTWVLGRALALDSRLVSWVVAGGAVVAANVVLSEVLLYADLWSPAAHLLVMGLLTLAATLAVPRYTVALPPAPSRPLMIGRAPEPEGAPR